jgi:thiol-disulfide isomerase/thioredoxin
MVNCDCIASWCPPCQAFTPRLVEFYTKYAKEGKLEIIFISSDRTVESFQSYYSKMPWLSLIHREGSAAIKNNLAQLFRISGIPTVMVFEASTGRYLTDPSREAILAASSATSANAGLELLKSWKDMASIPLEEIAQQRSQQGATSQNPIVQLVMFFAKNPVFIFGLLYFYKYFFKNWNQNNPDSSALENDVDTSSEEF